MEEAKTVGSEKCLRSRSGLTMSPFLIGHASLSLFSICKIWVPTPWGHFFQVFQWQWLLLLLLQMLLKIERVREILGASAWERESTFGNLQEKDFRTLPAPTAGPLASACGSDYLSSQVAPHLCSPVSFWDNTWPHIWGPSWHIRMELTHNFSAFMEKVMSS